MNKKNFMLYILVAIGLTVYTGKIYSDNSNIISSKKNDRKKIKKDKNCLNLKFPDYNKLNKYEKIFADYLKEKTRYKTYYYGFKDKYVYDQYGYDYGYCEPIETEIEEYSFNKITDLVYYNSDNFEGLIALTDGSKFFARDFLRNGMFVSQNGKSPNGPFTSIVRGPEENSADKKVFMADKNGIHLAKLVYSQTWGLAPPNNYIIKNFTGITDIAYDRETNYLFAVGSNLNNKGAKLVAFDLDDMKNGKLNLSKAKFEKINKLKNPKLAINSSKCKVEVYIKDENGKIDKNVKILEKQNCNNNKDDYFTNGNGKVKFPDEESSKQFLKEFSRPPAPTISDDINFSFSDEFEIKYYNRAGEELNEYAPTYPFESDQRTILLKAYQNGKPISEYVNAFVVGFDKNGKKIKNVAFSTVQAQQQAVVDQRYTDMAIRDIKKDAKDEDVKYLYIESYVCKYTPYPNLKCSKPAYIPFVIRDFPDSDK